MLVVSDASPLLNLAIVGQLDRLVEQFDEVLMPVEVAGELFLGSDRPGAAALGAAVAAGWLRVVPLASPQLAMALGGSLHGGEAAALALAVELSVPTVLVDEQKARDLAVRLGLRPVGVVGVLLRARLERRIANLAPVLQELRSVAGFWLSDALVAKVLRAAGEA